MNQETTTTAISAVVSGEVCLDMGTLLEMSQEQMVDFALSGHKEVIHRREADGSVVTGIVRIVRLRLDHEIVRICKKNGDVISMFIGAPGYYALAAAAGISILNPHQVMIDGEWKGNPHVERDLLGNIRAVTVRRIIIGRNASGVLTARDQTTILNPWFYLLESIHKALPYNQSDIMVSTMKDGKDAEDGWAFFPELRISATMQVGLLVNVSNRDVVKALSRLIQQQKKAMEIAQTFCDRNALKKFLGIPALPPMNNGCALVPVICWLPSDREFDSINAAARQVDDPALIIDIAAETSSETVLMSSDDAVIQVATVDSDDSKVGPVIADEDEEVAKPDEPAQDAAGGPGSSTSPVETSPSGPPPTSPVPEDLEDPTSPTPALVKAVQKHRATLRDAPPVGDIPEVGTLEHSLLATKLVRQATQRTGPRGMDALFKELNPDASIANWKKMGGDFLGALVIRLTQLIGASE